ncbi:hypothetical protein CRUP_013877, partial [Coryphaenoides rupestris]
MSKYHAQGAVAGRSLTELAPRVPAVAVAIRYTYMAADTKLSPRAMRAPAGSSSSSYEAFRSAGPPPFSAPLSVASFFGTEWQKRWCALSSSTFYYYGNEKDKQQKGEFSIDGYIVKLNNTLRKDSKKECCFEISSPDKRVYQFCASSQNEAEEWVKWIDFVLRDMSGVIPEEDDDDQEMYDDVTVPNSLPIDDDIYEELPRDQSDELSFKRGDAIYILSKCLACTE